MRFFGFFAVLLMLAAASPATAQESAEHHAAARLVSVMSATGGGQTVPVALGVRLSPGWKTYWRTPGEAGLAPVFDWAGSKNFKSAAVRWPAPHRYVTDGIENYVYEDGVIFPFDIAVEEPGKPLDLKLKIDLLVCKDICVPETMSLELSIPAGAALPTEATESYQNALKKVPVRDDAAFGDVYLSFDKANVNYLVAEMAPGKTVAMDADLFVEHPSNISFGRPRLAGSALQVEVRSPDPLEKIEEKLKTGEFTLTLVQGDKSVEASATLSARPSHASAPLSAVPKKAAVRKAAGNLRIALLAFLGGLILNLMPCVLPVLSLKVLSVLSHGGKEGRRDIFLSFSASALGILCSFWVMAAALAGLKAAGGAIGWGIQFQSPAFLVFLIAVVLAFAASMWGFFDIPLPRFIARNIPAKHEHEPTLLGHFLTGAFATLLATPCTAPFLGPAVGFALSRDAAEIFAVFTMIGLGLAAPYAALAVSPGLFRFLPKPGKWMVHLKKALSIALLATAVWLGSVLLTISTTAALDAGWQKFDAALIAPAVAEGKVVVVDVTADWCLTCKANKRLVLDQDDVIEALSGPEILLLQADWTQADPAIGVFLKENGRYGIPFNIVYGPAVPDGIPLPELLTKQAVLDALAEAAGE